MRPRRTRRSRNTIDGRLHNPRSQRSSHGSRSGAGRGSSTDCDSMLDWAIGAAQLLNLWAERAFRRHGRYVSRHPIQTLLLACLLITSSFYPAVGIYLWASKGGPGLTRGDARSVWRSLSTPFLDSFVSSGRRHHNSLRDLRMIWDDSPDLRALDSRDWPDTASLRRHSSVDPSSSSSWPSKGFFSPYGVPATYVPAGRPLSRGDGAATAPDGSHHSANRCRSVRLEHVFLTTDDILLGGGPKYGVLDPAIVRSSLQLQAAIEEVLSNDANSSLSAAIPSSPTPQTPTPTLPPTSPTTGTSSDEDDVFDPPRCVPLHSGRACLALSPGDYWKGAGADVQALDANALSRPPHLHVLDVFRELNVSSRGVPMSLQTTLAGRSHLFSKLPRADHLALTFFLEEPHGDDCPHEDAERDRRGDGSGGGGSGGSAPSISRAHQAFVQMLRDLTGADRGAVNLVGSEHTAAKELLLQFAPEDTQTPKLPRWLLLALGYTLLSLYISRNLVKMRRVHSRFGLGFTGAVELLISLIVSVSISALCGIRLSAVPWEVLPFVIAVVGSENMFVLADAVTSTPLSLTVPSRMAAGLGYIGVPIAITVLSDVALLLAIAALVDVRAVMEFCIFATFSLLVDFVLQMTFFATVLSIDLQRLELADLLSQGERPYSAPNADLPGARPKSTRGVKSIPDAQDGTQGSASTRGSRQGAAQLRLALWRARTARTVSLSLLLGLLFGLYVFYGVGTAQGPPSYYLPPDSLSAMESVSSAARASGPSEVAASTPPDTLARNASGTHTSDRKTSQRFDPFAHLHDGGGEQHTADSPWWLNSPSADFWTTLNPRGAPLVRVMIEPWTIVSLRSPTSASRPKSTTRLRFASWALVRPRVRAIIWFLKIVVLPILGTTSLLWVLLLYLLKDTQLLDAQRDKEEALSDAEDDGIDGDASDDLADGELRVSVKTLIAAHGSDIDTAVQSGPFVVSSGIDSTLCVWRWDDVASTAARMSPHALTPGDDSPVTALDVDDVADLLAIGRASGRVDLVSLSSLELLTAATSLDGLDELPASQVGWLEVMRFEAGVDETPDPVTAVSAHRDGSVWAWQPSRPARCLRPPPGGGVSGLWTGWTTLSSSSRRSASDACTPGLLVACRSSANLFEVLSISVIGGEPLLRHELSLPSQAGSNLKCAALSSLRCDHFDEGGDGMKMAAARLECSATSQRTEGTLVTGSAEGLVQAWDLLSGRCIASFDLVDGPVTRLSMAAATVEDGPDGRTADVVVVATNSQTTVLRLEGLLPGAATDASPSPGTSPSGTLRSIPPVRGTSSPRSAQAVGEGGSDTPPRGLPLPTMANAALNPLSPPPPPSNGTSSYETSSTRAPDTQRMRRVSSYRSRQPGTAADASAAVKPLAPLPRTPRDSLDEAPESTPPPPPPPHRPPPLPRPPRSLRVLTSMPSSRGGTELITLSDGTAALMGVRRRPMWHSKFRPDGPDGVSGGAASSAITTRWEVWMADVEALEREAWGVARQTPGHDRALRTADLNLEESTQDDDGPSAGGRHEGGRGSGGARTGRRNEGPRRRRSLEPSGTIRHAGRGRTDGERTGVLSFTRLRPVVAARGTASASLVVGFGNSLALVSLPDGSSAGARGGGPAAGNGAANASTVWERTSNGRAATAASSPSSPSAASTSSSATATATASLAVDPPPTSIDAASPLRRRK